MLIKTNFNKIIGFYVPSNFKAKRWTNDKKPILVFYWINQNSELVTSKRKNDYVYMNDYTALINLYDLLVINLNRSKGDVSYLLKDEWAVKYDSFGYPKKSE